MTSDQLEKEYANARHDLAAQISSAIAGDIENLRELSDSLPHGISPFYNVVLRDFLARLRTFGITA
jgi:hypothetical protein